MPASNYKIMLVAGETSGDMHAANLIAALRSDQSADNAGFDCFGMGLGEMKRAGLRQLVDASELSVIGLFEVIAHYPKLRRAYRRLIRALKEEKPDLLVLIDYAEFNLKLAADAKRLGVKTLFYISPQVWAWRAGRVKTIARRVDTMAVVFPFEEKIYRDANVPVRYVGHPLVERMRDVAPFRKNNAGDKKLLLMPGSRMVEVQRLLPVICRAGADIAARVPSLRCSLLIAPGIPQAYIERQLQEHHLQCELIREDAYAAMCNSDLAITTSGTATLELALCNTPMIIIYKVSWPTYWLLKRLVTTPHIGLVNIISGKAVVPELIQGEANADAIRDRALALLEDPQRLQQMKSDLEQVKRALGDGGTTEKLAELVREMVGAR